MKRFNSRYERIRRLRAQQEDACRATAAARNAERAKAETSRNEVHQWLNRIHDSAARDLTTGLTGAILQAMQSMMEEGERERQAADNAVNIAEQNLRAALQSYNHARVELKTVEEVIQQEHTEHRRLQLKQEEAQLQEQASQAYYRTLLIRNET